MDELKKAIEAAGEELVYAHCWSLDEDEDKPIAETLFSRVVLKHLSPLLAPGEMAAARKAKIAALRAELAALEADE